jgi:hypothetical protein
MTGTSCQRLVAGSRPSRQPRRVTASPLIEKSEFIQRGRDWTGEIVTLILQIKTRVLNPSKKSKQIAAA